ncbi:hypothetical protein ACFCZ1_30205 [Streptomyces sp. NPDC056224]|uniref:hypothetical protein n=1 Tax=Streptomyces sp. NPDC056224 TaxID=3345750 RepID=UPI0035DB528A
MPSAHRARLLGSVGPKVAACATTPVIVVRGTEDAAATSLLAAVRDEHVRGPLSGRGGAHP